LDKALIRDLCQRYRVPRDYADLAILVATYLADYQQAATFNAAELLQLLERLDAFRRPARLELFLLACEAIANTANTAASQQLRAAQLAAKAVKLDDLNLTEMGGEAVRDVLRQRQIKAIEKAVNSE
jgi:tRNA nucleotidyltransferase (CCA-adding enzyme)